MGGKRVVTIVLFAAAVAGLVAAPWTAVAAVWEASADYSTAQNPSGPWTYGFKPFDLSGALRPYATCDNVGGYGLWQWFTDDGTVHHGWITRNANPAAFQVPWGVWWKPLGINMHPGEAGERPAIRWTSPISGWVRVSVSVAGMEWAYADAHILLNNRPVWNATVRGFAGVPGTNPPEGRAGASPDASAELIVQVVQNDTIDCTVGYGADRSWAGDPAAVDFAVATIDDPLCRVTGTVRAAAPDNRLLAGVRVATSPGGHLAVTDDSGQYALSVAPGSYALDFTKSGYDNWQISPLTAEQGQTAVVNAYLSQSAHTWDAAQDFSPTINPGCVWSYGYRPLGITGNLAPYLGAGPIGGLNVDAWYAVSGGRGTIAKSRYPAPFLAPGGTWWAPQQMNLDPGAAGERPTIRWTSPIAGWVSVSAAFRGMSLNGATSDGAVLLNDVPVWTCSIAGFAGAPGTGEGRFGSSPEAMHSFVAQVEPADTIDCSVGWGDNAGGADDSTEVSLAITAVADLTGDHVDRIGELQAGTPVTLTGKTAISGGSTFSDCYFLEEPDRSSGVRVIGGAGRGLVAPGDSVTIWGVVLADSHGLYIRADAVTRSVGAELRPVGMSNRAAGGVTSVLARTWGTITAIDPGYVRFTIDDGSSQPAGLIVDCSRNTAPLSGLISDLSVGDFVVVTGVTAREDGGPSLRPRSQEDFQEPGLPPAFSD